MSKVKDMNYNDVPEGLGYTSEWIRAKDLEIDPAVQRDRLDDKKVEKIKRDFNKNALGIISVSRRNDVTQVIIDGWHRWRAIMELTDGTGLILCHVYEGLTPAQESQIFLDINYGNKPDALDRWRQELRAGAPVAVEVDKLTKAFQWEVSRNPGDGVIQAVGAVNRIYTRSEQREKEPNTLLLTLKLITAAWGHNRDGAAAVMLEGISAFLSEHYERLDWDDLEHKLKGYAGGPYALHQNATALASHKRTKVSMAVSEILTDLYNKNKPRGSGRALPVWTKRSP